MHSSLLSFKKLIYFLLVKGVMPKSQENKFAYPQQQIQPGTREMESCHMPWWLVQYSLLTIPSTCQAHCPQISTVSEGKHTSGWKPHWEEHALLKPGFCLWVTCSNTKANVERTGRRGYQIYSSSAPWHVAGGGAQNGPCDGCQHLHNSC